MILLLNLAGLVVGGGLLALGQQLWPRVPAAAWAFWVGGGVLVARELHTLAYFGLRFPVPDFPPPVDLLLFVVSVAALGQGLLLALDALFPPKGKPLPPALVAVRSQGGNVRLVALLFYGAICLAVLVSGQSDHLPAWWVPVEGAALVAMLATSVPLMRRGSKALWLLERRPDLVAWVYPFKLTVVSRRYGTRIFWRAVVGLSSGLKVELPAKDEQHAGELSAAIAWLCPRAARGYSPDADARFKSAPASMASDPVAPQG
jgi:hypothetical protein